MLDYILQLLSIKHLNPAMFDTSAKGSDQFIQLTNGPAVIEVFWLAVLF